MAALVLSCWAAMGSCSSHWASAPCRRSTYLRTAQGDASKEPGEVVSATQGWLLAFMIPHLIPHPHRRDHCLRDHFPSMP